MEEKIIDCTKIKTREDLHRIFRETLSFPDWYGNNLDALYDCLTEISGKVRLLDWETAESRLGSYGTKAKKAIAMAALHNTDLDLHI
jgi:ribonuclease inhibitor